MKYVKCNLENNGHKMYNRYVSEDGNIHLGYYDIMFGTRIKAGFTDQMTYELDWCFIKNMVMASVWFDMLLSHLSKYGPGENPFRGLPMVSVRKPCYKDREFMGQVSKHLDPHPLLTAKQTTNKNKENMRISIIAAISENNVIGKDGRLPWKLKDDMKFFSEKTKGSVVIMGRKNYESIPEKYRPLPGRINIVLSRQKDYEAPGCIVFDDMNKAIKHAESTGMRCFIIGGHDIYRMGLKIADDMYLTRVEAEVEGDVYFPEINQKEWLLDGGTYYEADERNEYDFAIMRFSRYHAKTT